MSPNTEKLYLSGPQVARRYGIDNRSLHRWRNDPDLNFPRPLIIRDRTFFDIAELEKWEAQRAVVSMGGFADRPNRKAA